MRQEIVARRNGESQPVWTVCEVREPSKSKVRDALSGAIYLKLRIKTTSRISAPRVKANCSPSGDQP